MDDPGQPLVAPADDVGLLCQVIAAGSAEQVLRDLAAAGYPDVRPSHGYIFQGLLAGDITTTQLALRLGVSAQAVSKTVAELEAADYVTRRRDERDGRSRTIAITERGFAMLATSRRARSAIADEIAAHLGARDTRTLLRLLRSVSGHYGGLDAIAARRVRPVRDLA